MQATRPSCSTMPCIVVGRPMLDRFLAKPQLLTRV